MNKCCTCIYSGQYDGVPICKHGIDITEAMELVKLPYCPFKNKPLKKEELESIGKKIREGFERSLKNFEKPTIEEVKKEWKELGYRIFTIEGYNICLYKYYEKYNEEYAITIDLQGNCYYCEDMDVVIDMKVHQLLTKTFRALGWFE